MTVSGVRKLNAFCNPAIFDISLSRGKFGQITTLPPCQWPSAKFCTTATRSQWVTAADRAVRSVLVGKQYKQPFACALCSSPFLDITPHNQSEHIIMVMSLDSIYICMSAFHKHQVKEAAQLLEPRDSTYLLAFFFLFVSIFSKQVNY